MMSKVMIPFDLTWQYLGLVGYVRGVFAYFGSGGKVIRVRRWGVRPVSQSHLLVIPDDFYTVHSSSNNNTYYNMVKCCKSSSGLYLHFLSGVVPKLRQHTGSQGIHIEDKLALYN